MCKECFNSYCVERWIETKKKAIEYLGKSCVRCRTEYEYPAMQFHHRNPMEKDVSWNKLRLRSWDKIRMELDKCDLVCSNCHSIIHSNLP